MKHLKFSILSTYVRYLNASSRRWRTTTTPDLALCTGDIHKNITREVAAQLGGSDHRPVILTLKTEMDPPPSRPPRWNYKKAKWAVYRIRTNELLKDLRVQGRNVDAVVKDFNLAILTAAKETIPRGATREYKPFWNQKLQEAEEELNNAREKAEEEPGDENHIKLQEANAKFLRTKLEAQRKGWRDKTSSLDMEREGAKVWRLMKAMDEEESRGARTTLEDENGNMKIGARAGDLFARSYAKESDVKVDREKEKEARLEQKQRLKGEKPAECMTKDITASELQQALRQLKKKKSPGPDGITNEMLTNLGTTAQSKLLEIFNLSWREGKLPQLWREAIMIPILKRGKNKSKAASYRPISLTSCVCKLMERIINKRMQWHFEQESVIIPEQAGFQKFRSTEDQVTYLSQVIEDAFQAQKVVLATFIDLQKAFDKVWKDGLLVKLLRSGISGNLYRWTKAYLHNRRARVSVDGKKSKKVLLKQGVPQGGVLSPSLFILFINDLVAELPRGISAALYADDLVLWCSEEYATTANYRMQQALDTVYAWAKHQQR